MERRGTVSLVGAGPGDPELITLRGLDRLRRADVVLHDRLIAPSLLDEARTGATLVHVGKRAGNHTVPQREIERLLVAHARAGRYVVRLKGGDPFLFGRGGEEMTALLAAGIPCEVVPGVSSALAAPAAAGIPVTHRGLAGTVIIVTGHQAAEGGDADWKWLARCPGTLVILMGLERIEEIRDRLIAGGRSPREPAAAVASATMPEQHLVSAPLHLLPAAVRAAELCPPAVIVVGAVAAFAGSLSAILPRPLAAAV